jgi:hypothetical protein
MKQNIFLLKWIFFKYLDEGQLWWTKERRFDDEWFITGKLENTDEAIFYKIFTQEDEKNNSSELESTHSPKGQKDPSRVLNFLIDIIREYQSFKK